MSERVTVLVIDDDPSIRDYLHTLATRQGYGVHTATDGESALAGLDRTRPDLITLDTVLPGMDGLETLRRIKQRIPEVPVIMLSGHGQARTIVEAMRLGATDFLRKPFEVEELELAFKKALENRALEEEVKHLRGRVRSEVDALLLGGDNPKMREVREIIEQVADTDITVLIRGESGTGKELVARAIHDRSPRQSRPLIKVNCSAVPDTLFESEFFGHVKGAFTGALADRPGRFEMADRGTLFLDEIGEVPLSMQAKLLRVLQEGEFERVGDTRTRTVDVRIIAATNRDLKHEIEAGRFRQDLYYRLSVFPVHIPPLRERREDIPKLALHFITQSARRMNRRVPRVTQAMLSQLAAHDWPGNVRELQNVVERAVILSQGSSLRIHLQPSPARESNTLLPPISSAARLTTREELKRQERENIVQALRLTKGKIFGSDGAAVLLGMKPTTLASRIKALRIKKGKVDS